MTRVFLIALMAALAGCNGFQPRQGKTLDRIDKELESGLAERKAVKE